MSIEKKVSTFVSVTGLSIPPPSLHTCDQGPAVQKTSAEHGAMEQDLSSSGREVGAAVGRLVRVDPPEGVDAVAG